VARELDDPEILRQAVHVKKDRAFFGGHGADRVAYEAA
jgi:hypothetical protein